jgi:hypothetical protein
LRQAGVAGGPGEYEASGSEGLVELRLDGVEKLRNVLVLIDEHWSFGSGEQRRVSDDGITGSGFIEIDDLPSVGRCEIPEQGRLAD